MTRDPWSHDADRTTRHETPSIAPPSMSDRERDARATMRLMVATTGAAVWPSMPLGRRERVLAAVNAR